MAPPLAPNNNEPAPEYVIVSPFNDEEMRVFEECHRESFYQRCLPIIAILTGGIHYGINRGYLRGHPRFGATPKVILATIVGYFAGKISYREKCAEKFMQLPHSQLGEILRDRKYGGG